MRKDDKKVLETPIKILVFLCFLVLSSYVATVCVERNIPWEDMSESTRVEGKTIISSLYFYEFMGLAMTLFVAVLVSVFYIKIYNDQRNVVLNYD